MDKELIAMCDTDEIQDKWERKCYNITVPSDVAIAKQIQVWFDGKLEIAYCLSHVWYSNAIYIPRIDDLLEWLGDKVHCLVRQSDEELHCDTDNKRWVLDGYDKNGIAGESSYADTTIKALMKAYMHLSHNKTWDGKVWI